MPVHVVISTGSTVEFTNGQSEFEVEAKNLRGVIREMEARYPGIGEFLEEETTVAIDGEIHDTAYFQLLREDSEVVFIPKLEGG